MKFVITGATSFLGLEFVKLLLHEGEEVIAVCRPNSNRLGKLPEGIEIVIANMSDYKSLYKEIVHADIFVNFAWDGTGHNGRDIVQTQKDNVQNTQDAYMSACKMGCKLFVESGSQAEYGTIIDRITEDSECHPFSEYGKAKLKVQKICSQLSNSNSMKYLHLRIFSLFGENDHPWTLVMSSISKMLHNAPVDLSDCTQKWNFLYVEDAAKQIYLLCRYAIGKVSFKSEIFNIASEDTRVLKDFVEEMKSATNSSSKLNFGVIKPQNLVSLNPDINKTKKAIGFISSHSFSDVLNKIIIKTNKK